MPALVTINVSYISIGFTQNLKRSLSYYEPTAEELALVDSRDLNLGYGSGEIEEKNSQSLYWQKDGKTYSLFGFDTGLDAEELLQMALEIQ